VASSHARSSAVLWVCQASDSFVNANANVVADPTLADPTLANSTIANSTIANPTVADPTAANPTVANPTVANPTAADPTAELFTLPHLFQSESKWNLLGIFLAGVTAKVAFLVLTLSKQSPSEV